MPKRSHAQLRRRRRGQEDRLVDPHISQVRREAVMKRWARKGKVYTPIQAELGVGARPVVAKGGMTLHPKSERRQDALLATRASANIRTARIAALQELAGMLPDALRVHREILLDRTARPEARLAAVRFAYECAHLTSELDTGAGELPELAAGDLSMLIEAIKAEIARRQPQKAQRTVDLQRSSDGAYVPPDDR